MFLFSRLSEDLSPEDSLQLAQRGCSEEVREMSGSIGVFVTQTR